MILYKRSLEIRGISNYRRLGGSEYVVFEASAGAVRKLKTKSNFTSIAPDKMNFPSLVSANAVTNSNVIHTAGIAGNDEVMVVFDTGVENTHSFISPRVIDGACFSTTSLISTTLCPNGGQDDYGLTAGQPCDQAVAGCNHGTHVAGIMGGQSATPGLVGLAPEADIISVQVFSKINPANCAPGQVNGCAGNFNSDLLEGLIYVDDVLSRQYPIAAINMSLGGGQYFSACDTNSPSLTAKFADLKAKNIAIVVATGNDGFQNAISSPACITDAIAVASSTDADDMSGFSNVSSQIDLVAPGSGITSSVPGGGMSSFNGTSMATPMVTGAIAALYSNHEYNIDQVEARLEAMAVPIVHAGVTYPRLNFSLADIALDVPAGANVWMRDTWNDYGAEPYAPAAGEVPYQSPNIWVRNAADGLANPYDHQNPDMGFSNYAYVKLHNTGNAAETGTVVLYWANANMGNLNNPGDWTQIGQIGNVTMGAHSDHIQEFPWANLPGTGHYCLLARWVPNGTPVTPYALPGGIGSATYNDNDIVWRNMNIIDAANGVFQARVFTRIEDARKLTVRLEITDPRPGDATEAILTITPPDGVRLPDNFQPADKMKIRRGRKGALIIPLRAGIIDLPFQHKKKMRARLAFDFVITDPKSGNLKSLKGLRLNIIDATNLGREVKAPRGVIYDIK